MILNDNKKVWAPDGREGFRLGKIVDIGSENITVQLEDGKSVSASYKRVFAAEDDNNKDHNDNCALMYLNEATLLNNIKIRYKNDKIYTYVANILIAVNPYHDLPNIYSPQAIQSYKGKSLGVLPPHVFAIADKAYRDMKVNKQSQSVIVSGESGAGKTESTKYILRYLTETYGQGGVGNIEKRIVEANPLLEAFGNAKTLRNLNSSRFGKYVEVHFDEKSQLVGAFVSHYLLEKSRIVRQNPGERNYHVFYRMCAGAPADMKSALRLSDAKAFHYLNKSSLKEPAIDDVKDFQLLDNAMNAVGIPQNQKANIYRIAAAVLHLGNITFQESTKDKKGGSELTPAGEGSAAIAAKLLGVQDNELAMSLCTRIMMTTKGGGMGTLYKIPLKPEQAAAGRDALAKAIYSKLFDHIVSCVNQCFPFKSSQNYIGVLDIAGFEFFEVNSFEQLCINYCNEKLQQFFNERILKDEQALYNKEGLGVKTVSYSDNRDCIDLFEQKGNGLMDLLDEEMKFPAPSDIHFTTEAHSKNAKHFRLAVPRKSPLSIHRAVKDDQGFLIRHFAGAVCYQTAGFLDKNNDALHDSLEQLLQETADPFLKALFPPQDAKANKMKSKKLAFDSVGKKFRSQLNLLMEKLKSTGSNFIRCIKPNDQMKSRDFAGAQILSQLQCAGMVSVLELMQEGFPSRTAFLDLHTKYKSFLPPKLSKLDPRTFCNALFRAIGMDEDDFKFGMTKVFFRPGKFAEFDQIMRSDPQALNALVSKVLKWIIRNRWKRSIWCAVSVQKLANKIKFRRDMLIRIQKTVKMFIAIRKHKPRYKGLIKMRTLEVQIEQLINLVGSLNKDKEKFSKDVQTLKTNVDNAIRQVKTTIMNQRELDQRYEELVRQVNNQLNMLRSQKAAQEEQEKMRKIQEQMAMEKRKQEEEERRRHEEEHARKERIAHEARMKSEAEQAERKRKEEDAKSRALVEKLRMEEEENEQKTSQQEAQERRDCELALRLAADPSTMISDEKVQLKRNIEKSDDGQYAKLKKWTYAELRDTINTSCDLELLEACRIEFHRRLKVYHAWRKRNMDKSKNAPKAQRAPVDIIREAQVMQGAKPKQSTKCQRYFRVPFSKPSDQYRDPEYKKTGWWYAHFDGEYVARQLEIHANCVLLLCAGKNDMEICELSLTETCLYEKPGAEITCDEFNDVWASYGGKLDAVFQAKPRK